MPRNTTSDPTGDTRLSSTGEDSTFQPSDSLRIGLLLAVTVLVYANTLLNDFTVDDDIYILRNSMVNSFSIRGIFRATSYNNVFRPFTFGTMALNWFLGDHRAFVFHFFNLLVHTAVVVLLFLVLRKLLECVPSGGTAAWAAALIFAVHPIHTEAVASASGCSELLAMGFLLGAWLLHLNDQSILALISFTLALLSKESAVVFLPLVAIGDYARGKMKPSIRYGCIAIVAGMYLGLLWRMQGGQFGERGTVSFLDNPLAHLPAGLRIANAVRIAWKYLGLQVYPANLSSDYSYNAILLYANWRHTAPAAIAAILVLGVWFWSSRTHRKEWFLAGAIYLAGFATTANILVPTGTIMGERLAYLPSAGYCLLVALIWIWLLKRKEQLAWAVLAIFLAALAVRTVARNRDWHDNFTLFSVDVKVVPGSAKIHSNLGVMYYTRGDVAAASRELQTALHIYKDLPEAMLYNGLIESSRGQDLDAEKMLEKALSLTPQSNPNYDFMVVSLTGVLNKEGKSDKALKLLDDEIARSPTASRAWSSRAALRYQRGDIADARTDAEMALKLDATNEQAVNLLSIANQSAPFGSKP